MIRFYVTKALEFSKNDSYIVNVNYETKKNEVYELGEIGPVSMDKSKNTWFFDSEKKNFFFYPFVNIDDCKMVINIETKTRVKNKFFGTAKVQLNEVQYNTEIALDVQDVSDTKLTKPQIFIYVETAFERFNKILAKTDNNFKLNSDDDKKRLNAQNYLYIYLESAQKLRKGMIPELQIYEYDVRDGGYSNLIGKTTEKKKGKKSIIKKIVAKHPFTTKDCTQLFYIDINELTPNLRFIPMLRLNAKPNGKMIFHINYGLYAFETLPTIKQDKKDNYLFKEAVPSAFEPKLVYQDVIFNPEDTLQTGHVSFSFSNDFFQPQQIQLLAKKERNIEEFAFEIRKKMLPKNFPVFRRTQVIPNSLYDLEKICDDNKKRLPEKTTVQLIWTGDADIDLSICALNKKSECVGHCSFKDKVFFHDKALQFFPMVKTDPNLEDESSYSSEVAKPVEPENSEKIVIKFFSLSKQVKTLLICITSYNKITFNKLSPQIKIIDERDNFELLYYRLSAIEAKNGFLFAAFRRAPNFNWLLIPIIKFCDESKPYDAHRVFVEELQQNDYITTFIKNRVKEMGKS